MPEGIQHLVSLDAFRPANGQSLYDMASGAPRPSDDWRVPPMQRSDDNNDGRGAWYAERRGAHPRGRFTEPVKPSAPLHTHPFSLTYIVATARADPSPPF